MAKKHKKASLKISGDELSALVGNAGYLTQCSDIGMLIMKQSSKKDDSVKFSVTQGELECLLEKLNFILENSEKYLNKAGKEYESLKSVNKYFKTELERQILNKNL